MKTRDHTIEQRNVNHLQYPREVDTCGVCEREYLFHDKIVVVFYIA